MKNDNGFELMVYVILAIITQLLGIGPKPHYLVTYITLQQVNHIMNVKTFVDELI